MSGARGLLVVALVAVIVALTAANVILLAFGVMFP